MAFEIPTIRFEFRVFPADEHGAMKTEAEFRERNKRFKDVAAAKRHAGALAKRHNGPVDLAYEGEAQDWNDRYITTATPSTFVKRGYNLERID